MEGLKRKYLNGEYLLSNPSWHSGDATWKTRNIVKCLKRQSLSPSSICEVGCGSGEILIQLSQQINCHQYCGYEISPQAFEICKTKESEKIKFRLSDLTQDNKAFFDLLLVMDVFEHVEDYFGFLRSLSTKSKYQIFHIPLDMTVSSILRNHPILFARQHVGHLHYFSKDTALKTLEDTGYKVIDSFYTSGSIDIPRKTLKTRLANLPRTMLYSLNPDFAVRLLGGYSLMVMTTIQ